MKGKRDIWKYIRKEKIWIRDVVENEMRKWTLKKLQ